MGLLHREENGNVNAIFFLVISIIQELEYPVRVILSGNDKNKQIEFLTKFAVNGQIIKNEHLYSLIFL